MRIHHQTTDYGNMHHWTAVRGPFKHGVRARYRTKRWKWPTVTPRVSMATRRKAIRLLYEWAATTREPRNRLNIIRRRWA